MKIMFVDDDALVLKGLQKVFESEPIEIVGTAENGEEAYHLALANEPDIIITDIIMPVCDGLELAKRIHETMFGVSVFMLSGHSDFDFAQRAMKYGVKNYYLKPINYETLNKIKADIRKISDERHLEKELNDMLSDEVVEGEILRHLKSSDRAYFDRLFDEFEEKCRIVPYNTVPLCIFLIDILHKFLTEISVNEESVNRSRRSMREEMLSLNNKTLKLNLVSEKYSNLLDSLGANKEQPSRAVALSAQKLADENFTNADFNISYLAYTIGCTPSYLSATFKSVFGFNLSDYISELRLKYAKQLLSQGDKSISETAQIVGYADVHYFTKRFKKQTGQTPTEFKNMALNGGIGND